MVAVGIYAIWSAFLWVLVVGFGVWIKKTPVEIVQTWVGANIITGIPYWLLSVALLTLGVI